MTPPGRRRCAAAGPAGDRKHTARLVKGKTLRGQLVAVNAGNGLALEGRRGVLDAGDGGHPGGEADPAAIAEQVLAEHQRVTERRRPAGWGHVDQVGYDVDGGQV